MWHWLERRSRERIDQVAENKCQIGKLRKDLDGLLQFFAEQGQAFENEPAALPLLVPSITRRHADQPAIGSWASAWKRSRDANASERGGVAIFHEPSTR